MRATVNAKTFAQALDQVSGLIHKSVIPVLNAEIGRASCRERVCLYV